MEHDAPPTHFQVSIEEIVVTPRSDIAGLSLVEVVVAMFLLALITVSLVPGLWHGITVAAQESSTATATRLLNELIEEARNAETCEDMASVIGRVEADGTGDGALTSSGMLTGCAHGEIATLSLSIISENRPVTSTTALIYLP